MANRFEGRVVIVTGGARGMGESHCRGFHAEGLSVVVADVLHSAAKAVADDFGEEDCLPIRFGERAGGPAGAAQEPGSRCHLIS